MCDCCISEGAQGPLFDLGGLKEVPVWRANGWGKELISDLIERAIARVPVSNKNLKWENCSRKTIYEMSVGISVQPLVISMNNKDSEKRYLTYK